MDEDSACQVPLQGSYVSALFIAMPSAPTPPVTRTRPSNRATAACPLRADCIGLAALKPAPGVNSSALRSNPAAERPPVTSTLPSYSSALAACARTVLVSPAVVHVPLCEPPVAAYA